MPQVFNKPVLLVFNAANTPQQVETNVTVPFKVNKIVFHPPFVHISAGVAGVALAPAVAAAPPLAAFAGFDGVLPVAGDSKDESYIIQSDLNPNGLGVIGAFSGVVVPGGVATATSESVEYVFKNPVDISGLHKFSIRGFTEAAGGAANPITAKLLINLEFHEAH